ncbi:hypothetical protein KQX54_007558 [Cotesia glomerata]|uniref:Uncharacterized protein n=1 Tax=Cotesia glomerata TaxID=32391 RepID=A0AAV7J3J3_COTGL|nr:hypothetical protein KQX54_007558 [Cotesia glomerata]
MTYEQEPSSGLFYINIGINLRGFEKRESLENTGVISAGSKKGLKLFVIRYLDLLSRVFKISRDSTEVERPMQTGDISAKLVTSRAREPEPDSLVCMCQIRFWDS